MPSSAYDHSAWWSNGGHDHSNSWIEAGWKVDKIELENEKITFKKFFLKEEISSKSENVTTQEQYLAELLEQSKNLILTGAPGTGKTYLAKQIAMQMIGVSTEEELEDNEQYKFVQFHPSYDYTDFVEGLRPIKKNDGLKEIGFELKSGIFKEFCEKAKNANKQAEKIEFVQHGGVDNFEEAWNKFIEKVKEKTGNNNTYDEVKTEKGLEMRMKLNENKIVILDRTNPIYIDKEKTYKFYKGLLSREGDFNISYRKAIVEHLKKEFNLKECSENELPREKKYIFIIDEINRGEVSKIFGELFFSIDPGYRGKRGAVETQYFNMHDDTEKFYVPENVYIIGTMNDIDRSVESFDFAMRRRFTWEEITAEQSAKNMKLNEVAEKIMKSLNDAISIIEGLNSSYHIGAAYFLKLKDYNNNYEELWKYHLKPLIKEYLRGMPDAKDKENDLKNAYDLKTKKSDENNG